VSTDAILFKLTAVLFMDVKDI